MNQFTQRSQKVMNVALQVARKLNSSVVGTEHLLAGLILEEQGVAARILRALNFPANAFLRELEGTAAEGHLVSSSLSQSSFTFTTASSLSTLCAKSSSVRST